MSSKCVCKDAPKGVSGVQPSRLERPSSLSSERVDSRVDLRSVASSLTAFRRAEEYGAFSRVKPANQHSMNVSTFFSTVFEAGFTLVPIVSCTLNLLAMYVHRARICITMRKLCSHNQGRADEQWRFWKIKNLHPPSPPPQKKIYYLKHIRGLFQSFS